MVVAGFLTLRFLFKNASSRDHRKLILMVHDMFHDMLPVPVPVVYKSDGDGYWAVFNDMFVYESGLRRAQSTTK